MEAALFDANAGPRRRSDCAPNLSLPSARISFADLRRTTRKDTAEVYPGVPSVSCFGAKAGYCPAPVFSAGFSADFFGAAATALPPFGFQKSSALIHSAGT